MSDSSPTADYGPGRYIPAVVDPSLKGIPEDVVAVDMMPNRDQNWLQTVRNDEVPEGLPSNSDSTLEERADEVWAVVEELNDSESVRQSQASD